MVAAGQVAASTRVLLPVTLIVACPCPWAMAMPSPAVVGSILDLALAATALAYIRYFDTLQRAGAPNLLLVTFRIRVSAILSGTQILGETLARPRIRGMGAIALGLAAIDGRLLRALRPGRRQ